MPKICKHCWHKVSSEKKRGKLYVKHICCHCGRKQTQAFDLLTSEEMEAFVKKEEARHGPYKPH